MSFTRCSSCFRQLPVLCRLAYWTCTAGRCFTLSNQVDTEEQQTREMHEMQQLVKRVDERLVELEGQQTTNNALLAAIRDTVG